VAGVCECGKEPSNSIKCGEILDSSLLIHGISYSVLQDCASEPYLCKKQKNFINLSMSHALQQICLIINLEEI
jgi:hypothetical protein